MAQIGRVQAELSTKCQVADLVATCLFQKAISQRMSETVRSPQCLGWGFFHGRITLWGGNDDMEMYMI